VYIVEDNASKLQEMINALPIVFRDRVMTSHAISNAYRVIANSEFDLIILDMTFQVSNEGGGQIAKESLAGVEVLQYMAAKRLDTPVIVATQHTTFRTRELPEIDSIEKLDGLLKDLFPGNYFTTVHVDLSGEAWKERLAAAAVQAVIGRGARR
jgi:CheY-like chemotaxis protein